MEGQSPGLPLSGLGSSSSPNRRHPLRIRSTIPDLLFARQSLGVKPSRNPVVSGVRPSILSSRAAWNPSRLQNMILSVGPGTPAGMLAAGRGLPVSSDDSESSSSDGSSSSAASQRNSGAGMDMDPDVEGMEEDHQRSDNNGGRSSLSSSEDEDGDIGETRRGRSRWTTRRGRGATAAAEDHGNESNQSDDDRSDNDDDSESADQPNRRFVESAILDWYSRIDSDHEHDDDSVADSQNSRLRSHDPVPSMRHNGCINTAAWLDCGWRLSVAGTSLDAQAMVTDDCPTQLITSGDDYLVKFWDVREAMGSTSPMKGGNSTICPFSMNRVEDTDSVVKTWRKHYHSTGRAPYGSVIPLFTLDTGHSGNVFHVTPLVGQPGKVASCGADGYLKVSDVENDTSTVVFSPEFESGSGSGFRSGIFSFRSCMCFSHHFITRQVGLVCSERGLMRFDLRLPPREQSYQSILGGPPRSCKACAVWSTPSMNLSLEEAESSYVFVAGASADVALCDLRMSEHSRGRLVQQYRPSGLSKADQVSVSGLDLSRDRRELLVSYESDQIYSFPIFPNINSKCGPTIDQIEDMSKQAEDDDDEDLVMSELATYGGHLNRFTFLKNAKYAGPNDEYICTGSDSGHAWIYEKATGAVVSLLNADHSTCNGVVPHPSLPVFITYGIDSTAKLWRASTPVDLDVDDSPAGRRLFSRQKDYEMSPIVRKWGDVQQVLKLLEKDEDFEGADILPDAIPSTRDILSSIRYSRSLGASSGVTPIGNDLMRLPDVLRQNLYTCVRSIIDGDDVPVESPIEDLQHRVSLIRLRHQADALGLSFDPKLPWAFHIKDSEKSLGQEYSVVHTADLVPDHPSDWIPYDDDMCRKAWSFSRYFNTEEYEDYYSEAYKNSEALEHFLYKPKLPSSETASEKSSISNKDDGGAKDTTIECSSTRARLVSSSEEEVETPSDHLYTVYHHLLETVQLLKEAGNEALRNDDCQTAARRYDKAIQYAAVASMSFPNHKLDFAKGRLEMLKETGGLHLEWGPLLKTLISCRLNMALLMLKPDFVYPEQALEQAKLAVRELKPFCMKKRKVMMGPKLANVYNDDEDQETYEEATVLLAKAYFRLGSAYYDLENFSDAIKSFENSVGALQKTGTKPDRALLKRLSEAKRQDKKHSERQRKKFKFAFGHEEEDSDEN